MNERKTKISIPFFDDFMKNGDMKMLMILLYKYEYTQPTTDKTKPYKVMPKWVYKKYKKEMILQYGKTERTWNRNFKKMIDNGYIEEEGDMYLVYNKSKDSKWFTLIDRDKIVDLLSIDDFKDSEFKSYVIIHAKNYVYKLNTFIETQICLSYFATVLGTNLTNAYRDYIGRREEGSYCEGAGILTKLEENGFIKIKIKKEKSKATNLPNNSYTFFICS